MPRLRFLFPVYDGGRYGHSLGVKLPIAITVSAVSFPSWSDAIRPVFPPRAKILHSGGEIVFIPFDSLRVTATAID
jgi:hypothetical protein